MDVICNWKNLAGLLLVNCILGCNSPSKTVKVENYPKVEVATYLPGTWIYLGFDLIPGIPDTSYLEYPNHPGIEDITVHGIKTDSGKFRHAYKGDSLLHIKIDPEVELITYTLLSGTTGTFNQFVKTEDMALKESRDLGFVQDFKWEERQNGSYLVMLNKDGSIDNVPIKRLDSIWFELDWGDNFLERYKRAKAEWQ